MLRALHWLKENNPLYKDIQIDENFKFSDDTFTVLNEKMEKMDDEAFNDPVDDGHLLTQIDLQMHAATDINVKKPAGTGLQHYLMKEMKGNDK
jgi:hypothetical protein